MATFYLSLTLVLCLLSLLLNDVLVCHTIVKFLMFVSKLTSDYPISLEFDYDGVAVKDKLTKQVLTQGSRRDGLYVLENTSFMAFYSTLHFSASSKVWHRRLGHSNNEVLQHLSRNNAICINKTSTKLCESCQLGKSSRLPFSSTFVATRPFERIHCDLWGPSPVFSVQGFKYYVIFIDHFSRYCWFYPLKLKFDLYFVFLMFQSVVENLFNQKIQ